MSSAGTMTLLEGILLACVRASRNYQGVNASGVVLLNDERAVEDKYPRFLTLQWDDCGMQSTLYPNCTQRD